MRMISVPKGEHLLLYQSEWVQTLCDSTFIDVWSDEEQDWNPLRVQTATVPISSTTTAVLLRCREAKTCPGLGVEVQLLEQAQGHFCFAKPQEFDLTRKAASGRTVRIFTWSEVSFMCPKGELIKLIAVTGPPRRPEGVSHQPEPRRHL